jgi:hypothetical protein
LKDFNAEEDPKKQQIGQIIEQEERLTGDVTQVAICGEGRLVASLE